MNQRCFTRVDGLVSSPSARVAGTLRACDERSTPLRCSTEPQQPAMVGRSDKPLRQSSNLNFPRPTVTRLRLVVGRRHLADLRQVHVHLRLEAGHALLRPTCQRSGFQRDKYSCNVWPLTLLIRNGHVATARFCLFYRGTLIVLMHLYRIAFSRLDCPPEHAQHRNTLGTAVAARQVTCRLAQLRALAAACALSASASLSAAVARAAASSRAAVSALTWAASSWPCGAGVQRCGEIMKQLRQRRTTNATCKPTTTCH